MKMFPAGTTERSLDNKIAFLKVENKQAIFVLLEIPCWKNKTRMRKAALQDWSQTVTTDTSCNKKIYIHNITD